MALLEEYKTALLCQVVLTLIDVAWNQAKFDNDTDNPKRSNWMSVIDCSLLTLSYPGSYSNTGNLESFSFDIIFNDFTLK